MIRRSLSRVVRACVLGGLVAGAAVAVPSTAAQAEPSGDDTVIAFLARGVGFGHGRGMSQWGAYGRAQAGHDYTEILDHYYGGTSMGTRTGDIRVRLTDWDGRGTFGVVSTTGKARWAGTSQSSANDYTSLYAVETSSNIFDVYGIVSKQSCPSGSVATVPESLITFGMTNSSAVEQMQRVLRDLGHDPSYIDGDFGNLTKAALHSFQEAQNLPSGGTVWNQDDWERASELLADQSPTTWTKLKSGVAGPITFSTTVADDTAVPGDVLGACQPDGSITHYRGDLEFWNTGDGNRVVNELDTELYLRGVVPKEVSASWPTESLKAQSVAARSYGLTQSRYSYASTCDTSSCQVYYGAATRGGATSSSFVPVEHARTNSAIAATAGDV
ncbi:MAG: SpoIID/LytB domain-containing protein, partial [Ilumatobacter fluminis]